MWLKVNIAQQQLTVFDNDTPIKTYSVSTAKNGAGQIAGSEQTPCGWHLIRAKIGDRMPLNTVFRGRRPTGEIYSPELHRTHPERDWILTRILWLSGLEVGKNRLGNVDTMRRYVYIHGTGDATPMGAPGSKGCIRMRNVELVELFDNVLPGTRIFIE